MFPDRSPAQLADADIDEDLGEDGVDLIVSDPVYYVVCNSRF